MKYWSTEHKPPEKNLQGSKPKVKSKNLAKAKVSVETKKAVRKKPQSGLKTDTNGVKKSSETKKLSILKNKWLYVGLILAVFVLCASTVGLILGVENAKSDPDVKIENLNNITVVQKGGAKKKKPGPKKIIKNGKEYFVMSKKQVC